MIWSAFLATIGVMLALMTISVFTLVIAIAVAKFIEAGS